MSVDNVTNTNTASAASGADKNAAASRALNTNFNDFLKLLTTQLQNQDPTDPADVNQMTQEIAALSQVEQQINTNSALQQLVGMFSASQLNDAVSYIGRQVDAQGNKGVLAGGAASFVYSLPAGVSTANVTINDSHGVTVFSGSGTTLAGRNQVLWNGTNSTTGATMPDGTYTFTVTAKDASGNEVTATTLTSGTVTAVNTQEGATTLSLSGIPVPLNEVKSIYAPGTNPGT